MYRIESEQEGIHLSKEKWRWMSERNVDSLNALFHEKAVFVHGETQTIFKLKNVTLNREPGFNAMPYQALKRMGFCTDPL